MFVVKFAIFFLLILQHVGSEEICHKFLRELGSKQALFVQCATNSAVPVSFCQNCLNAYSELKSAFNNIANNSNCTAMYFNKDRLNLVAATEGSLTSLWSKAYCDECFKNETIFTFNEKYSKFNNCVGLHPKDPCDNCALQYLDLNNFYIQLDQHNNGQVCFDIQDAMNQTRSKWSKDFECCRREFNMTLFTVALSLFSFLPFLFYGGAYLVTKRQERNHGILSDEDPLFDSSTSAAGTSRNILRNVPASSPINDLSQQSSLPEATNRSKSTKEFKKLNEDSDESSDKDNLAKMK